GVALCQVGGSGEKQILSAAGANARLTASCVRQAASAFTSAKVLLCQLGAPLEAVWEAIRLAKSARALVMLDPGPPAPVSDDLIAQLDLIRPNASEARMLTGIAVCDRASAREAARDLLRRGAKAAAVQAGEHGDVLLSRDREVWLPRLEVKRVAETGARQELAKPFRHERLEPGVDGLPVALVLHGDRDQRETEQREQERKRDRILEDRVRETNEVCIHADRAIEEEHPSPKQHAE